MSTETQTDWALSVEAWQEMWDAIAAARDAHPRLAQDADTGDIVDALAPLIEKQTRAAVVAELRRMADAVGPQAGVVDGSDEMTRRACAAALRNRADEIEAV